MDQAPNLLKAMGVVLLTSKSDFTLHFYQAARREEAQEVTHPPL